MIQTIKSADNLVLGAAKGYDFAALQPFLYSLKNSDYSGDVCLFVTNVSKITLQKLQDFSQQYPQLSIYPYWELPALKIPYKFQDRQFLYQNIYLHMLLEIYPINRFHLWGIKTLSKIIANYKHKNYYEVLANCAKHHLHVGNSRYFLYYLYILQTKKKYKKILLTDVRDVIFQDDPFNFDLISPLNCFYEDDSKTIHDCSYTSEWLKRSFGKKALAEIGHHKLSCAGTTIGTKKGILNYLERMMDYILESNSQRFGIDQASHNLILYRNIVPEVKFYDNYQGPVLTMNYTSSEKLNFNEDGFLVNENGSIINTLHQYDRKSDEIKTRIKAYRNVIT